MKYYRYMNMDSAYQALKNGDFIVQMPSMFDDPFECRGVMDRLTWMPSALDQFYRILCFCKAGEKHQDILLWSLYSDAGSGVRITFEIEGSIGEGVEFCDVSYGQQMPTMNCGIGIQLKQKIVVVKDFLKKAMKSKSSHWSWQEECRMIVNYDSPLCLKSQCTSKRWLEKGVKETCSINLARFVTEVTFGLAVDESKVVDLCKNCMCQYPHIEFYRTTQHPTEYKYCYEKLNKEDLIARDESRDTGR